MKPRKIAELAVWAMVIILALAAVVLALISPVEFALTKPVYGGF